MITVIIPAYNASDFISDCLRCILTQSVNDLEVIVVDDGSIDNTLELAQAVAMQDKRVKVIAKEHAGQAAARNRALEEAQGEYIAFIDADDTIEEDYFQILLEGIGENDVLQFGYQRVTTDDIVIRQDCPWTIYKHTSPCTRLFRREFIERNHLRFPEGMIYEDVVFTMHMWMAQPTFDIIHYAGYHYFLNPTSTTAHHKRENIDKLYAAIREIQPPTRKLAFVKYYTIWRLRMHFLLNR